MTALPDAICFDLDGTLVDSEDVWDRAKAAAAARHRAHWSEADARWAVGRATPEYAGRIAMRAAVPVTVDEVAATISASVGRALATGAHWKPGAVETLVALRAEGVRLGLVTMSYRAIVDDLLTSLPSDPSDPFDVVVAGDEVVHPKPHPEPYVRAAAALGVEPARAVAVEDTRSGASSALAAGMRVVFVPSESQSSPLIGCATVDDLDSPQFWHAVRHGRPQPADRPA